MKRYKVFPATEHRKHSNRFEVWDTELQQCKGEYVGRQHAQTAADILNGDHDPVAAECSAAALRLYNWDGRKNS